MSHLTQARAALVAWLRQDAGLAGHVRTWYAFGPQDRQPLDPAGVDCPALEIGPAALPLRWATNASVDEQYRLVARLYVRGMDVAGAEEFAVLYRSAVARGDRTNFGLPASVGLYRTDIGETALERLAENIGEDAEKAVLRYLGWRVSAPTTMVFRRDPTQV